MFRTVASLMLFGALSPVGIPGPSTDTLSSLEIAPVSAIDSLSVGSLFTASGALVLDVMSGKEIFGRSQDIPRSMGSLAKLMTAVIILDHHDLDEIVKIPSGAERIPGSVARLNPGERYTVHDLLAALLISSANDAAYTLAVFHSGDTAKFASEMNARARTLGLKRTHFKNPIGFDSDGQISTPRDLGWLSLYALKNETIQMLASQKSKVIRDLSGEHSITLQSTNHLLSSHPSQFFGLKTGTTDLAGECLIAFAYSYGRPYLFIIMHSSDRYRDTLELFHAVNQSQV